MNNKFEERPASKLRLHIEAATVAPSEGSASWVQELQLEVPEHAAAAHHLCGGAKIPSRELLPTILLPEEVHFYGEYPWCLNAFPTLSEVVQHLARELSRLDNIPQDWRASEVITNVFLLACAITDTIDDHVLGDTYDFSRISQVVPVAKSGIRMLQKVVDGADGLRVASLSKLLRWRQAWAAAITEFLKYSFMVANPDGSGMLEQRNRLLALLPPRFPTLLWKRRSKIPAFFRSRDFAPADCLELGEKFSSIFPEREGPAIVIGLRTAGSFLAPLLCAYLRSQQREADWIAVRPRKALARWEQSALQRAAQRKARALIIDESIHSGQTLALAIELFRKAGFGDEDIVVLNPVEPAFPRWRNSPTFESLQKITILTLEPHERSKQRLLESDAVDRVLGDYFKARGYVNVRVAPVRDPLIRELNRKWQTQVPERVDVRLKRLYEVCLQDAAGHSEIRHVLAKSVGCGWLSYHAFLAGQKLADHAPPILGLRDGILYTEWVANSEHVVLPAPSREALIGSVASYVAARTRNLAVDHRSTPDMVREGRHKGFELLAASLSRAYSSRIVAALERPQLEYKLAEQSSGWSVMTDSKMSPEEWIAVGSRFLKTDFEHHCHGKNELGMTDPAYDLASAMFHFRFSDDESAQLIRRYVDESGDARVEERLIFNKLLTGLWAQNLAILGLQNSRLLTRRTEFNQQYIAAWNFMVAETTKECGKLCRRPLQLRWSSPLVVTDIDGVLDRMVFGFPSTTAAGIQAISLFHAHGFAVAANTARTLQEVKQYCRSYGFVGGVAEYGAVAWDAISDRELVLVSAESRQQLEEARCALQRLPGIFLNDDYQCSLRAFTYRDGRTAPLPSLLVQDLLADLKADRLRAHHTGLDTAIVARETDKGTGLLALLAHVGLPTVEVLAIGDSEPDLAMFRAAQRSFAPGNVTCEREARLIGCHIVDGLYQPGLLQIARKIVHSQGDACNDCRLVEASWSNGKNLFVSLLRAADQKPRSLLLRNLFHPSLLGLFRK
jgi:hydroxymethylpyrimidine pyrophosphatase-like HAD family hydrolase